MAKIIGVTSIQSFAVAEDLTVQDNLTVVGSVLTSANVGAVAADAGVAAVEHGDEISHVTVLTLTDFEVSATEPNDEDLAVGATFYTMPNANVVIEHASFIGTFTKVGEATIADGEVAVGTLVGSTAVDTTGEVDAAAENVCGPSVLTTHEFDGEEATSAVSAPNLYLAAAEDNDLFLNVAATWPAVTPDGAVTFTGTITIKWRIV
jgi:hypothetical protein